MHAEHGRVVVASVLVAMLAGGASAGLSVGSASGIRNFTPPAGTTLVPAGAAFPAAVVTQGAGTLTLTCTYNFSLQIAPGAGATLTGTIAAVVPLTVTGAPVYITGVTQSWDFLTAHSGVNAALPQRLVSETATISRIEAPVGDPALDAGVAFATRTGAGVWDEGPVVLPSVATPLILAPGATYTLRVGVRFTVDAAAANVLSAFTLDAGGSASTQSGVSTRIDYGAVPAPGAAAAVGLFCVAMGKGRRRSGGC